MTIIPIWNTIARVEIAYLKKLAPSGDAATVSNTLPFSVFTPESNSSLAEKATFPEAHLEAEANTLTSTILLMIPKSDQKVVLICLTSRQVDGPRVDALTPV